MPVPTFGGLPGRDGGGEGPDRGARRPACPRCQGERTIDVPGAAPGEVKKVKCPDCHGDGFAGPVVTKG